MQKCYKCKRYFEPVRVPVRRSCPICYDNPIPPSLRERLSSALQGAVEGFQMTPRHRKPKPEIIDVVIDGKPVELLHAD